MADFGYTEGYRNTSVTKKAGEKSHFSLNSLKIFLAKIIMKVILIFLPKCFGR